MVLSSNGHTKEDIAITSEVQALTLSTSFGKLDQASLGGPQQ
jgi:hypothetical protein